MYSKTKVDKCVKQIETEEKTQIRNTANEIFDYWRKKHIEPLTEITLKIQEWLISDYEKEFYIAQRIKRKPQILRKLKRFSTRLTQLQDIGGCRIIVDSNSDVERIYEIIKEKNKKSHYFNQVYEHDYRKNGRDDSGYRALHIIVKRKDVLLEIQIRSRIQHYWAESIERASVISGRLLKELDAPKTLLQYFKKLSKILNDIELDRKIKKEHIDSLDKQRIKAEELIKKQDGYQVLSSHVNEQFIQSMIGKEKSIKKRSPINSWMIVFDWKKGEFLYWVHLKNDPNVAIQLYSEYEEKWPENEGFEVVLISSSSVFTIQETHSHYFGIEGIDQILDSIEQAKYKLRSSRKLTQDSVYILEKLLSHKFIGSRKVNLDTLRNHFCRKVPNIEKELTFLIENDFLLKDYGKDLYSLNKDLISEINRLVG